MKAVIIMIINGIEANLAANPKITRVPQIISNVAVKYAQNAGLLNPMVKNLPAPRRSGNKHFCIPSVKNIRPTVSLTSIALLSLSVLNIFALAPLFVYMTISNFNLFFHLHFKINITKNRNFCLDIVYHINRKIH